MVDLALFIAENRKELRDDIKTDVKQFLSKAAIFNGLFRTVFEKHLVLFIIQCLKLNLLRDLSYSLTNPESYDIIDEIYLRQITDNYFFDIQWYEQ